MPLGNDDWTGCVLDDAHHRRTKEKPLDQSAILVDTYDDHLTAAFFGLAHDLGGNVTEPQPGSCFDTLLRDEVTGPGQDHLGLPTNLFTPGNGQDGQLLAGIACNLSAEAQWRIVHR